VELKESACSFAVLLHKTFIWRKPTFYAGEQLMTYPIYFMTFYLKFAFMAVHFSISEAQ
jgi:hypothetical protein